MRDIEVGDMINLGCGWDHVRKVNGNIVWLETGGFIQEHTIKIIRKPRTGSKEARDIVAMLARNSNKQHNKDIQKMKSALSSYESDLESYDDSVDNYYTEHDLRNLIGLQKIRIKGMYRSKREYGFLSYRTAKAMLKEQV